jgi:hypothetical protein
MRDVALIVHSHMTKKGPPTYGPVTHRLVEYGVAQLRGNFTGQIREPLALVSLVGGSKSRKDSGWKIAFECASQILIHAALHLKSL